jgi:hypothetical protein
MRSFASVVIAAPDRTVNPSLRLEVAILTECATNRNPAYRLAFPAHKENKCSRTGFVGVDGRVFGKGVL